MNFGFSWILRFFLWLPLLVFAHAQALPVYSKTIVWILEWIQPALHSIQQGATFDFSWQTAILSSNLGQINFQNLCSRGPLFAALMLATDKPWKWRLRNLAIGSTLLYGVDLAGAGVALLQQYQRAATVFAPPGPQGLFWSLTIILASFNEHFGMLLAPFALFLFFILRQKTHDGSVKLPS